jgi:hypothetical protein
MAADDEKLLTAACDNSVAEIRALVGGGIMVDSPNRVGMRATHVAAMYGSAEALTTLLELGAPRTPAARTAPRGG